jgi:hypothetical protein
VSVPPLYEENFRRAIWAFQHQRVYDPSKQDIVHLSDVPQGCVEDLEFLGPYPLFQCSITTFMTYFARIFLLLLHRHYIFSSCNNIPYTYSTLG